MTESTVEASTGICISPLEEAQIRILHVDDETGFLKVAKQILETRDFKVDMASSVEEAIEKLKRIRYEVIVSDYQMPGKDGLQFLQELRKAGNQIPFIIFTGKGREEVAIRALNLGADCYLNKVGDPETVYTELEYAVRKTAKGKRAEEALKDSEEKFRGLFENAKDIIVLMDSKGNVISINNAAIKYGFKKGDITGKSMYKFVTKKHWPKLLKDLVQLSRGKSTDGILEINTPKGMKNVEYSTSPIIVKGKPVGIQAILRDVTERKEAEFSLKESEEKYRNLVELAPDSIMTFDFKGVITSCNAASATLSGYSKDELIGKHFSKIGSIRTRDIPKFLKMMPSTIRGKAPKPFEVTYLHKDGTTRLGEVHISLMKAHGKNIGLQAIMRDITERKTAEERIRESERKYRNIVELSPDGIAVMNMKGFVISINPAFSKLTGFSKEELVGKHFTKLGTLRMRDLPTYLKYFRSMIRGRLPDTYEFKYVRKDGSLRSGDARFRFLVEDGRRVGLQAVLRDITERKKAEETVNKTLAKLKELNEKLEVVGGLTRHDIRNKLSTVLGRIFLAKQKLGEYPEAQEDLAEAQRAVKDAEQILNFAKEYESLGQEELAYVSVGDNVKSALSLLPMAGAELEGIKITDECQGVQVLADSMLQQLFYNLIDNSVKHGKSVSQIGIRCKTEKNALKLIYEDNGAGIKKSEKEKIFKKGYGKGTGYGLYLIKKMCEVYGWTIKETGKQGKGAQFTITIPKLNEQGTPNYKLN